MGMENVLLIGSGGREHALAWKLAQSEKVKSVFVAPGNAGTASDGKISNVDVNVKDFSAVCAWCKEHSVELVIVGPEDPLAAGIADTLNSNGIACFGPSAKAAEIEASKAFAKDFMTRQGIPTAQYKTFNSADEACEYINKGELGEAVVVKASGLAAGKGVVVAASKKEACDAVNTIMQARKYGDAGDTVVVEEFLKGDEVSVLAFTDGENVCVMPPAQDHKQLEDGDGGPNTGGMGALCPYPKLSAEDLKKITTDILEKTVKGLKNEERKYVGVLYAGLMITDTGPKVLEFNCRFGDPETQSILPLLRTDLLDICRACVEGKMGSLSVEFDTEKSAVGVVVVSGGYPGSYKKGKEISVPVRGPTSLSVRVENGLSYKEAGVDIEAGDDLVQAIMPLAKSTSRTGCTSNIGMFGATFDLAAAGYKDPILVSGTDGVGTKLKIAEMVGVHNSIGIDLVAMCVNDILAHGAEPLFLLDYFATGRLNVEVAQMVVGGIAEGCRQAGCALVGGETAEMPGMYTNGEYDVAGFAVGAVERGQMMPRIHEVAAGDVIVGIGSSGIHSNGFSLVRKLVERKNLRFDMPSPLKTGKTLGEDLLTPTKIYVKSVLPLMREGKVKAFAHITGGGLTENIPRILPDDLGVTLDAKSWNILPIFGWLSEMGRISSTEMARTFNCGLGGVLIVTASQSAEVVSLLRAAGEQANIIGSVRQYKVGTTRVRVDHLEDSLVQSWRKVPGVTRRRRVGVLISGSGTNLQALLDHTRDVTNSSAAEIVLVISNKAGVQGLSRAEKAGIKTKVISHKDYKGREEFDEALHQGLTAAGVEIVCLAGFMRILTGGFVRKWTGRMLNVHPSLLPSFKGSDAHKQVLASGVRISGCSVHFVAEEVDAGAILVQESVPVYPGDTETSLSERVKRKEHKAFPQALEIVATQQVSLSSDGKLVWNW
ncbi:LOW QUALITY PROTEIN: trifunctional purine biosynthetic protein adenosine-3-like [Haliotis rubra]|uniref:LOW QUALITY PROTEIN: trifunctional purine biosynthetic protein adenosine-3-like n=1 Tax=Haliotis rubra TaxID=36100 RepID=UPI001EE5AF31|nr:LOW QUALITY PROTEIN: trifunctional purine biosynthetic protein adenosine-3-like [Haliotis rubra]